MKLLDNKDMRLWCDLRHITQHNAHGRCIGVVTQSPRAPMDTSLVAEWATLYK